MTSDLCEEMAQTSHTFDVHCRKRREKWCYECRMFLCKDHGTMHWRSFHHTIVPKGSYG